MTLMNLSGHKGQNFEFTRRENFGSQRESFTTELSDEEGEVPPMHLYTTVYSLSQFDPSEHGSVCDSVAVNRSSVFEPMMHM